MNYAVIIPSKLPDNLVISIAHLMKAEPELEPHHIIVVDDGARTGAEPRLPDGITWVKGARPFIYARNCNRGIEAATEANNFVLLNDDALLMTPRGLSRMVHDAQGWGLVTATTNYTGNHFQYPHGVGLREETRNRGVPFICVCIPSWFYAAVGPLDERFTTYGFEDQDYCQRAREAGLRFGVHDGCYVEHGVLPSTFRGAANVPGDITPGERIYREKWGDKAWPTF